ncbi:MAG: glycerol-3-phosphate 1-O-acyltransferase PlsY [Rhodobacteraceae bacterium]|nr:glycerol-3-phosphate 1-O-acyltransferase PlsY [Paracoccaceae bacterium]
MFETIVWDLTWQHAAIAVVIGYVLGSIPFGLVITRLGGHGDIRDIGSGNIGTTNVLRTGSKKLAALTLLGDALKGTAAALIVGALFGPIAALVAGMSAFLGHLFPIWLGFKGGKGVATYLGILLALNWPIGLAFAAIWIAMAFTLRYSSLSALTATLATPILLWVVGTPLLALGFGLMSMILWAKHHENIGRLLNGTESRIGNKSAPSSAPPDPQTET